MNKIYLILLIITFTNPSYAEHAANQDIKVQNNEAIVVVNGIVCSFCAKGAQKKISKLPFIDKSKYRKGVFVDIENQLVTFAIKSGEKVDLDKIYKAIKSGGYEPIKILIADANGQIETHIFKED